MRHTPLIFISCEGQLYIKVKYTGINFLCLLADGVPLTMFDKGRIVCLKIEDAISWHEREIEETKGRWPDMMLIALQKARDDYKSGKMVESEGKSGKVIEPGRKKVAL